MHRPLRSPFANLRAVLALLLAMALPGSAAAWNGAGHRLCALIAWNALGAADRQRVDALLQQHPDAWRWARRAETGEDLAQLRFTEASTWSDDIRHDRRFYDADREPATPVAEGFPDMARHRSWHFLNLPIGQVPPGPSIGGEIDRRLARLAETVADPDSPGTHRAYALTWLIHLVADIHQPLHVATRPTADGRDDAGGNDFAVVDPENTRRPQSSLHAWWDDLPGPPWLRGRRLAATAAALDRTHPVAPERIGSGIAEWRNESFRLAQVVAYSATPDSVLADDYRQLARQVAGERIVLAGKRLARLLRELVATGRE